MSDEVKESLLEFPARFPIKIMGKNDADFREAVLQIAEDLIPEADRMGVTEQLSKNQRYLSLTVTAMFYEKPAIDRVYQALSKNPHVLMAL